MSVTDSAIRVLVIDDDEIAREALASTLESAGFDVSDLPSAIGASRLIAQKKIDAVVLDVMMPDINGDKLARLLRQNSNGSELAIVLVSSRSIEELELLAAAAGADAVVPKQSVRSELAPAVRRARKRRLRKTVH